MKRAAAILLFAAGVLDAQRFEAADVHRSDRAMNPYTFISGGVLRGTRYDLRKVTMLDLIRVAYGVDPDTVVGGPNWLEFDRFDIAAKAPARSSPETVRLMLQALLADRFKLVLHRDTRPMPAFALTTGKGKSKLTPSNDDANPDCQYVQQPAGSTLRAWSCRNATMKTFAERLRGIAGDYLTAPVIDATGLDGYWDFDLRWHGRSLVLPAGTERVTVFEAVDRQLGLKLELRDARAPVLVIERANETPTPNAPDISQRLPPREVSFEVADLKPSRPDEKPEGMVVTPGGGLYTRAMDMRVLMAAAWDIDWDHLERFANLPKWVESARFDIQAKASTNANSPPFRGAGFLDDETRLMLRALLVERFKIKWHYEDRPVEAYTLAAGRPKMKRGDPAKRANCKEARTVANDPRDTNPLLSELLECRNATMSQFAQELQELDPDDFAYPAEDATGLDGTWDFLLSFSPRWQVGQKTADGTPNGAIPIDEAIGKQLGLKLENRKRMLPVVVIDRMEEKPTEN